MDDTPFPLDSHEHGGHWVGVSETKESFMTFKILSDDMKNIIHCSNIHSACDPSSWNLQMDPINDEPPPPPCHQVLVIKSFRSPSASLPHGEDSMDATTVTGVDDDACDLLSSQ
jgi:hypothetical protein